MTLCKGLRVIHLDTSVLIDALTGPRRSAAALWSAIVRGERVRLAPLVPYEWQRGPRLPEELTAQEALVPAKTALVFGPEESSIASALYREVPRGILPEPSLMLRMTDPMRSALRLTAPTRRR